LSWVKRSHLTTRAFNRIWSTSRSYDGGPKVAHKVVPNKKKGHQQYDYKLVKELVSSCWGWLLLWIVIRCCPYWERNVWWEEEVAQSPKW
jgi:hypothetical protein